jgi:thiol-disulfide isomerase/thioredoxin
MSTEKKSSAAIWRARALNLLLIVAVIAGIRTWQHRDMVSGTAPPLHGVLLDGSAYKLPVKSAQPVLVHFWSTWCPICRAEQGSIDAISHDYPNVITVAMKSGGSDQVVKHLAEQGLSFPVLNDPDGSVSAAWGVHAVPASFIISPDGQIRFIEVGYTSGFGLRFRLWLAAMLG